MLQVPFNKTYVDRSDNILRVPTAFYEDSNKKRKLKKIPKRTIQKIIKKNRIKTKKIYVNAVTKSPPTITSKAIDSHSDIDESTTETRRRMKKNSKVLRYHMPFQKLQKNKHRNRRETDRNDVYLLKDFDEIEFVQGDDVDKDNVVVKAHMQPYW
ncbi:unnamed protein product [Leptidea sinapis]|uniref:Uncharacterized protein n=1 Tax=Leptidea sinapis TaxID=189913 RepID=A0A5E4Q4S4_9NEOP|nr:unnamed protein product [Leptidea sinapis]